MVLSTAYLPPVSYFKKIAGRESILIEAHEHFVKQTYRNRCRIYGANGVQDLSIPLVNTHQKILISQKRISYKQNWQTQHWRSIESAYRNSPYFIYYADELKPFFENKFEYLLEFNTELLKVLLKLLKIKVEIQFTKAFEAETAGDYRNSITPKIIPDTTLFNPYHQVFSEKHGFKADLSIVDLLFNKGPDAADHLIKK